MRASYWPRGESPRPPLGEAAGPCAAQTGSCGCQRSARGAGRPHASPRLRRPRGGSSRAAGPGSGAAGPEALGGPRFPRARRRGGRVLERRHGPSLSSLGAGPGAGGGASRGAARAAAGHLRAARRGWGEARGIAGSNPSAVTHLLALGPRAVAFAIVAATICRGPGPATYSPLSPKQHPVGQNPEPHFTEQEIGA